MASLEAMVHSGVQHLCAFLTGIPHSSAGQALSPQRMKDIRAAALPVDERIEGDISGLGSTMAVKPFPPLTSVKHRGDVTLDIYIVGMHVGVRKYLLHPRKIGQPRRL